MIILYRNSKIKILSPDGDTDFFNIVVEVLQGDTIVDLSDKIK